MICIDPVAVDSYAGAYLPAARCKPKPVLLPGSIPLLIGCGSLFLLIHDPADGGYLPLLIRDPAPPLRHGPADGGAGSGVSHWIPLKQRHEGTAKASGAIMFAGALAEATLQIKGGGAAQGAHNKKVEAPQTGRCCGRRR